MSRANPMPGCYASRGILTMAFGKPRFIEQVKSLGRSILLHAPDAQTAIVTDSDDPQLREIFMRVIKYRPELGSSVRQKLHLDLYSPFEETLFIDSDCLVLGNLESFWTAFAGQTFGVPGSKFLTRGMADPYLDVAFALDYFGVEKLPKFNGGTYYFNKSDEANDFFFDRPRAACQLERPPLFRVPTRRPGRRSNRVHSYGYSWAEAYLDGDGRDVYTNLIQRANVPRCHRRQMFLRERRCPSLPRNRPLRRRVFVLLRVSA